MSVMRVFEIKSFYFGIIFDSERSCKDSREFLYTPHTSFRFPSRKVFK